MVSWLLRALGETPDGGLVITYEYFQTELGAGRRQMPGMNLRKTRNKRQAQASLVLYDVTPG